MKIIIFPSYFIFYFDVPRLAVKDLQEEYNRDVDIIRNSIAKESEPGNDGPCTLHDEMLPPPYRYVNRLHISTFIS